VERFFRWTDQGPVLLADTIWISASLVTAGVGQQFFLFYFIELFLAAVSESLGLLALGAVLIGTASIVVSGLGNITAASLIDLPFFFATAIFYGYVVDMTKQERRRAAEREEWAKRLEEEVRARTHELEVQRSELQTLYKRVLEVNRLQSEFVANMSHELRTPLNGIIGYASLLADDPALRCGPEAPGLLERITKSARALHRLVESVLEYGQLERGRVQVLTTRFPVDRVLGDLQALCEDIRPAADVRVDIAAAPGLELETDYDRLYSALSNLLLNALKFTPRGTVEVRVEQDDGHTEFCVRDTGVGIPAEALDHIFEPFRQVDGSSTRAFGGVGLGLAIVRRNATLLGGRVTVGSRVGSGSEFRLRIPSRLESGPRPLPGFEDHEVGEVGGQEVGGQA